MEKILIYDGSKGLNLESGSVDEATGIIRGVSIATAGVQAIGHESTKENEAGEIVEIREYWTDAETLETILECVDSIGQPLKAKVEHETGLMEIVGEFSNFRIEGDQLKADFEAYPTSKDAPHILTLAKRVSRQFGVSITAHLQRVKSGAIDLMRCVRIDSADFVDTPAINAGLFSQKNVVDKQLQKCETSNQPSIQSTTTKAMDDKLKEEITELMGTVLTEKLEAVTQQLTAYDERMKKLETPEEEELSEEEKLEKEKLEKEELAEEKAMKEEMSALRDQVTGLSAKLSDLGKLGLAKGPGAGTGGDENREEPKTFEAQMKAKIEGGKTQLSAFNELCSENIELVQLAAKRKGVGIHSLAFTAL